MRKIQKNKKLAIQGFKERVEAALYACPHDLGNRIFPQMFPASLTDDTVLSARAGRHKALPLHARQAFCIFESLNF
ncbi:hypothetical protein [Segatella buccae]|uniref:hypothetical protein n=1 Tax=Segatella buccae TaxID=28126 RepID=UPI0022E5F6CC|nr:hypothetical protein [Segatella buccae]